MLSADSIFIAHGTGRATLVTPVARYGAVGWKPGFHAVHVLSLAFAWAHYLADCFDQRCHILPVQHARQ